MLDLFCGRFGWSRAFAARGWECVGVDLVEPPEIPQGCTFIKADISHLELGRSSLRWAGSHEVIASYFDFICASSPCEKFSVFDMKFWFPTPPYPEEGIQLFEHTRQLLESAGVPYIMENVRAAQQFVGQAVNHCGPFYLWGNAVPPILPQGITKGSMLWSPRYRNMKKSQRKREVATIPPELASCVCDYAERLLEQRGVKAL
jgi:hypothetical protein